MELQAEIQACGKGRRAGRCKGITLFVVGRPSEGDSRPFVVEGCTLQATIADERGAGAVSHGNDGAHRSRDCEFAESTFEPALNADSVQNEAATDLRPSIEA